MYQELYFVSFTVFLFFLDLFFIQLFWQQCFFFVYIFSLVTMQKKQPLFLRLLPFIFLALESLIIQSGLNATFFAAMGTYLIAWSLLEATLHKNALLSSTLLIFLILKSYKDILHFELKWLLNPYTILTFIGNFVIVYFSLKWLSAVKRGNRF